MFHWPMIHYCTLTFPLFWSLILGGAHLMGTHTYDANGLGSPRLVYDMDFFVAPPPPPTPNNPFKKAKQKNLCV